MISSYSLQIRNILTRFDHALSEMHFDTEKTLGIVKKLHEQCQAEGRSINDLTIEDENLHRQLFRRVKAKKIVILMSQWPNGAAKEDYGTKEEDIVPKKFEIQKNKAIPSQEAGSSALPEGPKEGQGEVINEIPYEVIMDQLCAYGADINKVDAEDQKSLITDMVLHQSEWDTRELIGRLVKERGLKVDPKGINGFTPLLELISSLPPSSRADDRTKEMGLRMVDLLLSLGADFRVEDAFDKGALEWASIVERFDVMQCLVKHGLRVQEYDAKGVSPLGFSMRYDRHDITDFLFEQGADVNATYRDWPVLHWAASTNNKALAEKLIQSGARLDQLSLDQDKTAWDIAQENEHFELADYLKSALLAMQEQRDLESAVRLQILNSKQPGKLDQDGMVMPAAKRL